MEAAQSPTRPYVNSICWGGKLLTGSQLFRAWLCCFSLLLGHRGWTSEISLRRTQVMRAERDYRLVYWAAIWGWRTLPGVCMGALVNPHPPAFLALAVVTVSWEGSSCLAFYPALWQLYEEEEEGVSWLSGLPTCDRQPSNFYRISYAPKLLSRAGECIVPVCFISKSGECMKKKLIVTVHLVYVFTVM